MPRTPEEVLDASMADALPGVVVGFSVAHTGYAVANAALLAGTERLLTVGAGAAAALAGLAAVLVLRRHPLPPRFAHPAAALVLGLALGVAVLQLVLAGQPAASSAFLLLLVAAGAVLLDLRWLLALLYLTWGAWVGGAVAVGPSREWAQYVAGLVAATGLSLVVHRVRRGHVQSAATTAAEAEAAAVRDTLTGVANRRGLALVGAQMVEQARRQGDAVHCIFVDIDDLKSVNEALGTDAGDAVLGAVAEALREVTRATDVVARWGGDEFCVVGPGAGMAPLELERRVRDTVAALAPVPEAVWSARVTAGGAMLEPWDAGNLDTLLGKADQEMYLRRSLRREGPPRSRPSARPGAPDLS